MSLTRENGTFRRTKCLSRTDVIYISVGEVRNADRIWASTLQNLASEAGDSQIRCVHIFSGFSINTKLWTIFSIFLRDAAYPFRTHSTPLECGRLDIPFSIDIALRWSAGGWIYRFLFSLRSNSTPLECGRLDIPFSILTAKQ